MGKNRFSFDEAKIGCWFKAGRGTGRGVKWRASLGVADVSSCGLSHRLDGRTTQRVHHFFSKIEMRLLVHLDWADHIVDIGEQFPLDRDKTRQIAADLGVKHPTDPTTRIPIVMRTDIVVDTAQISDQPSMAFAVKPSEQLGNTRTLEKLEIERVYWQRRWVKWKIVTERELATPLVNSLVSLHSHRSPTGLPLPLGYTLVVNPLLLSLLFRSQDDIFSTFNKPY
jgi:hypothetical protein